MEPSLEFSKSNGTKRLGYLILAVLLILLVLAVGYFVFIKNKNNQSGKSLSNNVNSSPTATPTSDDIFSDYALDVEGSLPNGFPKDIPLYPKAKVNFQASDNTDGVNFKISLDAPVSQKTLIDYYKSELTKNGWQIDQQLDGDTTTFAISKGTRQLNMTLKTTPSGVEANLSVTNE